MGSTKEGQVCVHKQFAKSEFLIEAGTSFSYSLLGFFPVERVGNLACARGVC